MKLMLKSRHGSHATAVFDTQSGGSDSSLLFQVHGLLTEHVSTPRALSFFVNSCLASSLVRCPQTEHSVQIDSNVQSNTALLQENHCSFITCDAFIFPVLQNRKTMKILSILLSVIQLLTFSFTLTDDFKESTKINSDISKFILHTLNSIKINDNTLI